MSSQRTHYVTTTDGVTIGASVHGQGPPLVFLHGIIGDGDLDFQALVPHLADRFTCHLPSWRGRGLSGDHPNLSFGRMVDDFIAYLDSVGEPAGLVGWSAGADLALTMAAQSDAVAAVAALEPSMPRLLTEQQRAAFGDAFARMGELAAEGRLTDAMRAFADVPFKDDEIAALNDAGYLEASGRYVPTMLSTIQQQPQYQGPTPDDPAVLSAISSPVLVLHGSDSKTLAVRAAKHVADHVPHARTHQVPGAGHVAPLTHPEALAEALTAFFAPAQQSA
jgi:pimeloyl-ACP methyl ester carboxylesterase